MLRVNSRILNFRYGVKYHSSYIIGGSGSSHSSFDSNRLLNELSKSGRVDKARQLFDEMPIRDEFTWNTMIAAYSNSGRFSDARRLFKETPVKSPITWSSLLSGYCRNGCESEAFELFWHMQLEGQMPSQFTLSGVLRLCSTLGLLQRGEQIHGYSIKTRFDLNDFVLTGLVDMYAKCKCISEAEYLFEMSPSGKNHVMWTAMVTGYSLNGESLKAIKCFRAMRVEGVESNHFTFPGILTACAAVCARSFGAQVHGCIVQIGYGANVFVQSALVDMYAKCGDLNSAKRALENMGTDDVVSWNSMIVGCVRQGYLEDALILFKKMRARDMKTDHYTFPSILNSFSVLKEIENAKSVHCLIIKTGFEAYVLV